MDFKFADFADDAGKKDSQRRRRTNDAADERRGVGGVYGEQNLKRSQKMELDLEDDVRRDAEALSRFQLGGWDTGIAINKVTTF